MITRMRDTQVPCQLFGGMEIHFQIAINRRDFCSCCFNVMPSESSPLLC